MWNVQKQGQTISKMNNQNTHIFKKEKEKKERLNIFRELHTLEYWKFEHIPIKIEKTFNK